MTTGSFTTIEKLKKTWLCRIISIFYNLTLIRLVFLKVVFSGGGGGQFDVFPPPQIFKKDVPYDNIQSPKKPGIHPLFRRSSFWKTTEGGEGGRGDWPPSHFRVKFWREYHCTGSIFFLEIISKLLDFWELIPGCWYMCEEHQFFSSFLNFSSKWLIHTTFSTKFLDNLRTEKILFSYQLYNHFCNL